MKLYSTLLLCSGILAVPAPEDDAATLLARAEAKAGEGKYKDARRLYEKLAKDFEGTPEGRVGARRSLPSAFLGWADIVRHGASANRVDVVVMGEGYQLNEQKGFDKLAADLPDYVRRNKTLGEYYEYFNFLRANLVSADNGVDGFGREYDTALNGHVLGTYAGHVGVDDQLVRAMLHEVPEHDGQAIVFTKTGTLGTGGRGVATIGGRNMKTAIHEFGHSFGRLSDEYSTETHKRGAVSRNVNVTNDPDPEKAPWKHWLAAKVPGIGMYEGAAGQVRGAWKPTASGCVMQSGEFFCPVCREELVLLIYALVDPIDRVSPAPHGRRATEELTLTSAGLEFEVDVLRPESHALEVRWWVLPESEVPIGRADTSQDDARGYRRNDGKRDPGRLPVIAVKPALTSKSSKSGEHTWRLTRSGLAPGRYRVLCRVTDTTKIRGEKHPWVLEDERGLLESQVGWWVRLAE
jgi:hypothetical protein